MEASFLGLAAIARAHRCKDFAAWGPQYEALLRSTGEVRDRIDRD